MRIRTECNMHADLLSARKAAIRWLQFIKPSLATATAASCDGRVHLFVCLFLFVCLSVSPNCKNVIFPKKTKQFIAMVSIDDL